MGIEDRKAREFRRREEEILDAALALAGSGQWQSVTIDSIAERAEIGKGTVYKHFKSKDEVCARIVMDHGKELIKKLKAIDPALDYIVRFKATLRTVWHHNLEKKEILALNQYCEVAEPGLTLSPEFAEEFLSVREEIVLHLSAIVEEGIDLGILPRQPIEYMMHSGRVTMAGAMRLAYREPPSNFKASEDYLEYLIDFILKGLMNAQRPMPLS